MLRNTSYYLDEINLQIRDQIKLQLIGVNLKPE